MTRFVMPDGVRAHHRRRAPLAFALVVASMLIAAGCSSVDTGTSNGNDAELACLDTCEALARAGERCGLEYKRLYDMVLRDVANGDCKNVVSIRHEATLRDRCLPALRTEPCADVLAGQHDASCSTQLQRSASFMPPLFRADQR